MKVLNYSLLATENAYKLRVFLLVSILFFACRLSAQTLRGTVRDATGRQPLPGATVELVGQRAGVAFLTVATDSAGQFAFGELRPGYYRCTATAQGYTAQTLTEIAIAAGKDQEILLLLLPATTALPDVTITASAPGARPFRPLSEIPLSREQTLRFPATFFDPARLALAYPGVAGADDQANGLVIRGNGPGALRWRLEGVDIVNPNHLSNAGTFSDRPALASGGVLLFSAQLLDNSALLTGAFPAGYGDALGGVMDIGLRRGNAYRHEFTAQAGLIGLDLAAEGPLGARGRNSYLVNYRYSTVGLLGQMGISFGDEAINFQDLSFKLSFNGKKGGQWSFFGVGGLNENLFERKSDSSEIKIYKDFFDINFRSRTGIIGMSNFRSGLPGLPEVWWKFSAVVSGQRNERNSAGRGVIERDWQDEVRAGLTGTAGGKLGRNLRYQNYISLQSINYQLFGTTNDFDRYRGSTYLTLMQVAPAFEWSPRSQRVTLNAAVHGLAVLSQDENLGQASLEPRLSLSWRPHAAHRVVVAYGRHSQLAPLWAFAVQHWPPDTLSIYSVPQTLRILKADHINLAYRWTLSPQWVIRMEYFYQNLFNIPNGMTNPAFSLLNVSELQPVEPSFSYGKGRNTGLELGTERYLNDGWFLLANTTLFKSETQGRDRVWRPSRWASRYIANITAGKEWQRDLGNNRTRAFGLNGRVTANGGFRERPIDLAASEAAAATVFDESAGFSLQQPGFFRVDLRVYWKRSIGNRRNSTFAMDFQNATFGENIAYRYYDPYTRQIETKQQLGLIPNLSWRIEF